MEHHLGRIIYDINILSSFLSDFSPIAGPSASNTHEVDIVVICASAVLHQASTIFTSLQTRSLTAKTLVLCGGVGHSTRLIWDAVAHHPEYHVLSKEVRGLPEARVLELLLNKFFKADLIRENGCEILIEDRSTNCGANAAETRKVLENAGVKLTGSSRVMVVQDPTMALRTKASFAKVYEDVAPSLRFVSQSCFVPCVRLADGVRSDEMAATAEEVLSKLEYDVPEIPNPQLWSMGRSIELLVGEIPRLRDDENGYGPKGKGFITHVDIPEEVEDAWKRLHDMFRTTR